MSEQQDTLHISYLRGDITEPGIQRLIDIYDNFSRNPWDKDEIFSYLRRKDTTVCLIENRPGDLIGFALCQPRDGTLYVDELHIRRDDVERRYSHAKYANAPTYSGDKTAAGFLIEHMFSNMQSQNCTKADFSAIRDKPIVSEVLDAHYARDPRLQAPPDVPVESLSLRAKAGQTLEKLRYMTGVEWKLIKKSPGGRDIGFSLPADAMNFPKGTYFRTEGKMMKPYAAYHAARREIGIDAEYPEMQVNTSGMADKVYLPANWAENILQRPSQPDCLKGMFIPSDKNIGGDFGKDFLPFR